MVKLITGSFMFVAGLFFLATGVGAIIGIPMFVAGLAMGIAGFASIGKTAVKTGVAAGKIAQEYSANRSGGYNTAQQPQALAGRSTADEIAKLAGLLDAGHITQAEFDAQKARILGA